MKQYIVNGKAVKAKSILDAVKKVKDSSTIKAGELKVGDIIYSRYDNEHPELVKCRVDKIIRRNGLLNIQLSEVESGNYFKTTQVVPEATFAKDSTIRDAYYNVGGYIGKYDPKAREDIRQASKYGVNGHIEKTENGYQLVLRGEKEKLIKCLEDYFRLDASSVGDSKCVDAKTRYVIQHKYNPYIVIAEEDGSFHHCGIRLAKRFNSRSDAERYANMISSNANELYNIVEVNDSKCKDSTISYKGYDIEFNFYGKNEYTVQYQGDDVWFKTIEEAKKFIDDITSKKDSKSCKDMPYNGTSQVKEINKGYAIVLRSRWEKYGVNSGIETWEPSLDGAKAHKDSLSRADGLAFVIIDCNTKRVIDSKCKDESSEELVKRYQKRVDTEIESFGRIGGALYDALDDNGLYVKEENGKYIVKKKTTRFS